MIPQAKNLFLIIVVHVIILMHILQSKGATIKYENEPVCETETCRDIANEIIDGMDTRANPCNDFYQYACGNWGKNYQKTNNIMTYMNIINNKTKYYLKDILESNITSDENSSLKKAKELYKVCMNTSKIESQGIIGLVELINQQGGGWPMTMDNQEWILLNDHFNWQIIDESINKLLGKSLLFNIQIKPDAFNTSSHIIQLSSPKTQTAAGLSLDENYLEAYMQKNLTCKYINGIGKIAKLIAKQKGVKNISDDTIAADARNIVILEIKLNQITRVGVNTTDQDLLSPFTRLTIDELQRKYDSMIPEKSNRKINWLKYIRNYLSIVPEINVNGSTIITVHPLRYFINLAKVLDETPKRDIVNTMHWWLISELLPFTNQEMLNISREFSPMTSETQPRWIICTTGNELKHAISHEYIQKYFSNDTKKATEKMVGQIIYEMKEHIGNSTWMDLQSKQSALDKLNGMKQFIGFPDWYLNENITYHYYNKLKIGDNYMENYLSTRKFNIKNNLELLNTPVDKKKSNLIATVVNAYHDYPENSLSIPAVILQRPFYSDQQPDAVNYGGIGGVIGHEISHGFDDIGRRYDKKGNLKNWWSNNTLNDYKKRAWCFVDKFKKYSIISQNTTYKLNSIKTLSENIADSTGIRAVFKAFEKYSINSANNMRLNGLEKINTKKLFFLSYAHSFCEAMPLNKMVNMLMTDVHSPAAFRMIGTLSNMKEFANVFECSNKTIMNPPIKCGLWY